MEPTQGPDGLGSLLDELLRADDEHTDVSVSDPSGWTRSAFRSGKLVWENVEDGDGPWHIEQVNRDRVLQLFRAVVQGDLPAVQAEQWQPGY